MRNYNTISQKCILSSGKERILRTGENHIASILYLALRISSVVGVVGRVHANRATAMTTRPKKVVPMTHTEQQRTRTTFLCECGWRIWSKWDLTTPL